MKKVMSRYTCLFLLLYLPGFSLAAQKPVPPDTLHRWIPRSMGHTGNAGQVIHHTWYTIGYSTELHIPLWTYYVYTAEMDKGRCLDRKGSFRKDPLGKGCLQAGDNDYKKSRYDKGHLVPCEDMTFDSVAMSETFYYTNAVPQTPQLNEQRWADLEALVRNWAGENGELHIYSGIIMDTSKTFIGKGHVAVPLYCYKVILDNRQPVVKAIAFILPNIRTALGDLKKYTCTVQQVELKTGLDFMSELPDKLEHKLESTVDTAGWTWPHHR